MLLGSTYFNKDCMACVRVERNFLPVLYTTHGERPKVPHVLYASNRRINVNGF